MNPTSGAGSAGESNSPLLGPPQLKPERQLLVAEVATLSPRSTPRSYFAGPHRPTPETKPPPRWTNPRHSHASTASGSTFAARAATGTRRVFTSPESCASSSSLPGRNSSPRPRRPGRRRAPPGKLFRHSKESAQVDIPPYSRPAAAASPPGYRPIESDSPHFSICPRWREADGTPRFRP